MERGVVRRDTHSIVVTSSPARRLILSLFQLPLSKQLFSFFIIELLLQPLDGFLYYIKAVVRARTADKYLLKGILSLAGVPVNFGDGLLNA